jgi:membrane-bound serine protease (ClpP class)
LRPGLRGRALTPLHPSGKALIDGHRVDVVSEGEFVDADSEVEVISAQGSRITVRPVAAGP